MLGVSARGEAGAIGVQRGPPDLAAERRPRRARRARRPPPAGPALSDRRHRLRRWRAHQSRQRSVGVRRVDGQRGARPASHDDEALVSTATAEVKSASARRGSRAAPPRHPGAVAGLPGSRAREAGGAAAAPRAGRRRWRGRRARRFGLRQSAPESDTAQKQSRPASPSSSVRRMIAPAVTAGA